MAVEQADVEYLSDLGFSDNVAARLAARPDIVNVLRTMNNKARVIRVYRGTGTPHSRFDPERVGLRRTTWVAPTILWPPLKFMVITSHPGAPKKQSSFGTMIEFEIPIGFLAGDTFNYQKLPNKNRDIHLFISRFSKVHVGRAIYELSSHPIHGKGIKMEPPIFSAETIERPLFEWVTYIKPTSCSALF